MKLAAKEALVNRMDELDAAITHKENTIEAAENVCNRLIDFYQPGPATRQCVHDLIWELNQELDELVETLDTIKKQMKRELYD